MREALDVLVGVISELRDEPYSAVPLLVMAAVVEGGLAGTLAAMLQVRHTRQGPARGRDVTLAPGTELAGYRETHVRRDAPVHVVEDSR